MLWVGLVSLLCRPEEGRSGWRGFYSMLRGFVAFGMGGGHVLVLRKRRLTCLQVHGQRGSSLTSNLILEYKS